MEDEAAARSRRTPPVHEPLGEPPLGYLAPRRGSSCSSPSARWRRAAAAVSSARGTKGAIHEDDDAEVSLSSTAMGIAEQLADAMAAEDAAEDARSAAAAAAPPPIYDSGRVRRSVATWE